MIDARTAAYKSGMRYGRTRANNHLPLMELDAANDWLRAWRATRTIRDFRIVGSEAVRCFIGGAKEGYRAVQNAGV